MKGIQRKKTCVWKSCLMCDSMYKKTGRSGQSICLKRQGWRMKKGKKRPLCLSPPGYPRMKIWRFSSEIQKTQTQFSDLSGQQQGLEFSVFCVVVNFFICLGGFIHFSYMRCQKPQFLQKQSENKYQTCCHMQTFSHTLSYRDFYAIPLVGHRGCVKSLLKRAIWLCQESTPPLCKSVRDIAPGLKMQRASSVSY